MLRSPPHPTGRLVSIRLDAMSGLVENREIVLGGSDALLGGVSDVQSPATGILRLAVAIHKHEAQVVVCVRMALGSGDLEHARGSLAVLLDAATLSEVQSECERRLGVSELGPPRVPLCRDSLILRHAETFGVDATNEGMGLRVTLLGCALGQVERGQISPLLEGDIGRVLACGDEIAQTALSGLLGVNLLSGSAL